MTGVTESPSCKEGACLVPSELYEELVANVLCKSLQEIVYSTNNFCWYSLQKLLSNQSSTEKLAAEKQTLNQFSQGCQLTANWYDTSVSQSDGMKNLHVNTSKLLSSFDVLSDPGPNLRFQS